MSLDKVLDRIAKLDGLEQGLIKATARVETTAKELCPVDDGTLRSSITSTVHGDIGYVGTNVEYAKHVEFGTINQQAQPYLFPALEINREQIAYLMIKKGVLND